MYQHAYNKCVIKNNKQLWPACTAIKSPAPKKRFEQSRPGKLPIDTKTSAKANAKVYPNCERSCLMISRMLVRIDMSCPSKPNLNQRIEQLGGRLGNEATADWPRGGPRGRQIP